MNKNDGEILLIDKPVGITSFDVIRQLREQLGVKKMGHAGTLDPLASGLLIVATGSKTKELNEYLKLPKVYTAEILVGESRITGDMEGEITASKAVAKLTETNMKEALGSMVGKLELPVPRYSAIKVDGEALYKKARRGDDFEPPKKPMQLISYQYFDISKENDNCVVSVQFEVGSGTYIRSLAEEFGQRLGYPATLKCLRRISVGQWQVKDAKELDLIN